MARIRTLKPEFWDHEQLGRASTLARLTFAGLISQADDEGRGRADSDWLWGRLHAFAPPGSKANWARTLSELEGLRDDDGPLVVFYKEANASYYWLPGFCRQQYIEKPGKSKFPPPPNSGNTPLTIPFKSPLEGIRDQGRERKGEGGDGDSPLQAIASQLDSEDQEVEETVRMYFAWSYPSDEKKAAGVAELRSIGLSHETIRSGAKLNRPADVDFWTIKKALEAAGRNGKAVKVPGVLVGQSDAVAPRREVPPVLLERREVAQKRRDDAKAKCREILLAMDPAEREVWALEAKAAADKERIIPAAVTSFIESLLLSRVAKEKGIEGL